MRRLIDTSNWSVRLAESMIKSLIFAGAICLGAGVVLAAPEPKKIVLVAGTVSHGAGEHEFKAGCLLLKKCLDEVPTVKAVVQLNGWPQDESIFEGAAAIFIYADGGDAHPAIQDDRLQRLAKWMDRGVGLACAHYAVEVPTNR